MFRWTPQTVEQGGRFFSFQDREKIRSAVTFFNRELFATPDWLFNTELFSLGVGSDVIALQKKQELAIFQLADPGLWNWLLFNETNQPKEKSFNYDDLLTEMEKEIWKELDHYQTIDVIRRNLQKVYANRLIVNLRLSMPGSGATSDLGPFLVDHINRIHKRITQALPHYKDRPSRLHLEFVRDQLAMMLNYQKKVYPEENRSWAMPIPQRSFKAINSTLPEMWTKMQEWNHASCWQNDTMDWMPVERD